MRPFATLPKFFILKRDGWCGILSDMGKIQNKKDGIAAGDTFNGAFAVALVEGNSCAEAIAFAQKAASISVTRAGAQSSVPYRSEIR